MGQQTVGVGAAANDGTGDPIRTAFEKVNDNFDELYGDLNGAEGRGGRAPVGGIIMWSGSIAEAAALGPWWALCDGTANAPGPDLRDKFIVGASEDESGAAKTNLTGALTTSGGSISHHHADHAVTQPAVSDHGITQPAISNHSITQPVISNHSITQPAISDHSVTQPAISNHAITQPVVGNHAITQPVVGNHAVTTSNCRTSASAAAAAVTAISAHSLTTNVALSAHSLTTNVALDAHSLSTQVAVSAHGLSAQVALSAHGLSTQVALDAHGLSTQVALSAHSLSASVAVGAHDTLAAPQPYYALAFIQRME